MTTRLDRASSRRRRACLVVHAYFPADPRVRRQAEALAEDGWALDVVCLRGDGEPVKEEWRGVRVRRLPVRRHRGSGLAVYALEYLAFLTLAALWVAAKHLRRRYDLVQAHNIPDFLVFAAAVPRLLGAKVVLDIRDTVPDLYASKFGAGMRHPVVRLMRWLEARSAAFADRVVTVNEPSRRRLVGRDVPVEKVEVVLNSADPRLFRVPAAAAGRRAGSEFTLMYHGGLYRRYGLDVAIRAVGLLRERLPHLRLRIYGEGEASGELERLVEELDLCDRVQFGGQVSLDRIPELIQAADLGVVPYLQDTFTDLIYPTKAFEYVATGIPVVMSRTAGVAELFAGVPDAFVSPGDVDELADRIAALHGDRGRLMELRDALGRAYTPLAWEPQRRTYLSVVDSLVPVRV